MVVAGEVEGIKQQDMGQTTIFSFLVKSKTINNVNNRL